MNAATGLFVIVIAIALYFIPAFIANSRRIPNAGGVFVVNLLVGWTFIGWIIALVMACSGPSEPDMVPAMAMCPACRAIIPGESTDCPRCGVHFTKMDPPPPTERKCPFCAEMIKVEAIVCRYCHRDVEPLSELR